MNISSDKVASQFSLYPLLTLYVLHDQMFITCHIIKWISSQQKPCKLTGHFQRGKKLCEVSSSQNSTNYCPATLCYSILPHMNSVLELCVVFHLSSGSM